MIWRYCIHADGRGNKGYALGSTDGMAEEHVSELGESEDAKIQFQPEALPASRNAVPRRRPINLATCATTIAAQLFAFAALGQTIALSPKGGPPTTTTTVSGSGFSPQAAIDIYFDTGDQALAIANGTGAFSAIGIEVPASALPGKHWVTAIQRSNETGAQVPFTVYSNWNQFHFTANHKAFDTYENVLSASSAGGLDVKWSYAAQAAVLSSPAIAQGVLYAASYDSNVYALKISNGTKLWSYATGASVKSSPAVLNGVVYVGSFDKNVYALNAATGAVLWSFATGLAVESSPAVANGVVYVGSDDDNIYALNATTGAELWSYTTGGPVVTSPAVVNGVVYFGSHDSNIYALEAATGELLWSHSVFNGTFVESSPAVATGVVYVGCDNGNIFALNSVTGTYIWYFTSGAQIRSSPAVANGVVYVGSDDGNVYALNGRNGSLLWSYGTGAAVESSPAVANGVVYVGSGDGGIYGLSASTGGLLWSYNLGMAPISSPAVASGVVYIGASDNIYAFGLVTGMGPEQPSTPPDLRTLRPNFSLKPSQPIARLPDDGDR
jgi:outer membrane protein assembly factor BamB